MNTFNRTSAKFYVLVALLAQSNHALATSIGKFFIGKSLAKLDCTRRRSGKAVSNHDV